MNKKHLIAIAVFFVFYACKSSTKEAQEAPVAAVADSLNTTDQELYKNVKFDAKTDLVCGMPVTAGVSDTAHYQEKVYGFCAKECKDEFLKNPATYLTASVK